MSAEITCEYCCTLREFVALPDNYDGAADGNNTYGSGSTRQAAIDDLIEKLDELALPQTTDLGGI